MTQTWSEQLKMLKELQLIDSRIFLLNRDLSAKEPLKKSMQDEFEAAKVNLKAAEQALKDIQLKLKERENDLGTKEANIRKYEVQQSQVKTNKEYSALTHEIKNLKADCSIFEDEILGLMDQIEQQKKKVEAERQLVAVDEKKLKEKLTVIDREAGELKQQIQALSEQRAQYTPRVDKPVLSRYENILKKREGQALVSLKDRMCNGCRVNVTHKVADDVHIGEKMIECESCGRLLFHVDQA